MRLLRARKRSMVELDPNAPVEVAYGTPARQAVVEVPWQPGLTARVAVERSGLLTEFPQIDARTLVLGRFGERISESQLLRAGDRVEICRPLVQDPREMRREVLARGGVIGKPKA
jgi:putative ubiquitin-RnfH superfamily antitoxin RatB of RatAB toxin-antitoxin module